MEHHDFAIAKPTRQHTKSPVRSFCYNSALILRIEAKTYFAENQEHQIDMYAGVHTQMKEISLSRDYNQSFSGKSLMLERLDKLRDNLDLEWDGYAGLPMEREAYVNTRSAIWAIPGKALLHWNLFPCPNGTFLLAEKRNLASVNIGNNDFSYAAYLNEKNQIKGVKPYTDDDFISVIHQINGMLGYEL